MNLHEYQGKQLFAEYGLPVSKGYAVDTPEEAMAAADKIGGDMWVVKATPQRLYDFASNAHLNSIKVIIAGAGGAAHLPGMVASLTHLPVLGVPVESKALKGLDSLLSIAQMPFGIPVASLAIGESGAKNSALLAASILSLNDKALEKRLISWRNKQTKLIAKKPK